MISGTSAIFKSRVNHTRLYPHKNQFTYGVYGYLFNLKELPSLQKHLNGFSFNQKNIVSLHSADYLSATNDSLEDKVKKILIQHENYEPIHDIFLLTSARYFGYAFNPVSFFFVYGPEHHLHTVIAEVHNTFGETHVYLVNLQNPKAPKTFHVSPFFSTQGHYEFLFDIQPNRLNIHINLIQNNQKVLLSSWNGHLVPLTQAAFLKTILAYPFGPLLTVPRITYQAAKLFFLKRLPVYTKPIPMHPNTLRKKPATGFQRLCQKAVLNYLAGIQNRHLQLKLPYGELFSFGDTTQTPELIHIHDYAFFTRAALHGDVGFAESFMAGEWSTPTLTHVIELFILNAENLNYHNVNQAWYGRFLNRLIHLRRSNSIKKSKHNIQAHYDLSNAFFKLFLDTSLMYSSAVFQYPTQTLEEAQHYKRSLLIKKAKIQAHHHVLEIGSGWGSFAIQAARETGCKVTTITLSEEQFKFTQELIKHEKLEQQITIKLCDYRQVQGQFDRIVSIEMIEAVGEAFLPSYFKQCDALLKPDGLLVLQAITIPDHRYATYKNTPDFIQKHIFPGGFLPSISALCQVAGQHTPLVLEELINIGPHYASTLAQWKTRFLSQLPQVKTLGFDEVFIRKWEYYLSYCEAGFATRHINTHHLVFSRPNNLHLDVPYQDRVM